jgi:hypothetical protein
MRVNNSGPCVTIRSKVVFYGEELSTPHLIPKVKTTHCRPSTTAYSIYSQLFVFSVRSSRTRHAVTTGTHINRGLHNEELRNLYASSDISRVITSRRMRWLEHVARMGEMRNV